MVKSNLVQPRPTPEVEIDEDNGKTTRWLSKTWRSTNRSRNSRLRSKTSWTLRLTTKRELELLRRTRSFLLLKSHYDLRLPNLASQRQLYFVALLWMWEEWGWRRRARTKSILYRRTELGRNTPEVDAAGIGYTDGACCGDKVGDMVRFLSERRRGK